MKRFVMAAALAALVAGSFAQEMAWINPYDFTDPLQENLAPGSMPAWVSRGIYYDEWDTVFRAPAELSNYSGISFLTAYGNDVLWKGPPTAIGPGPGTTNNPFIPGALVYPQNYAFGIAMPLMEWRMAALAGLNYAGTKSHLAETAPDAGDGQANRKDSLEVTVDANTIGTADYSYSKKYSHTDYSAAANYLFGGGVDLGFLGAALHGAFRTYARTIGGTWDYSYSKGADAAFANPANYLSSGSWKVADGAPKAFGRDGSENSGRLVALVELPLKNVLVFPELPVTAELGFGWSNRLFEASGFDVDHLPASVSYRSGNIGGAGEAATQTYSFKERAGDSTTWMTDVAGGTLTGVPITAADLETAANTRLAAMPLDMDKIDRGNFSAGIKVGADPSFRLSDGIKAVSRVKMAYQLNLSTTKDYRSTETRYVGATASGTPGDGTGFDYVSTASSSSETTATVNKLDFELGGVFEFQDASRFATLGVGGFLLPSFSFSGETAAPSKYSVSKTLTEKTAGASGAAAMPATTTQAGAIGIVDGATPYVGERGYSSETATSGEKSGTYAGMYVVVPVSVKLDFAKQRMQLVGGYDLITGWYYNEQKDTRTSKTTYSGVVMKDGAGASVYTADVQPVSEAKATATAYDSLGHTPIGGTLNWMFRWTPVDSMTIDISGNSLLNAFDFGLLGGAGFNAKQFVERLHMAVTFRF